MQPSVIKLCWMMVLELVFSSVMVLVLAKEEQLLVSKTLSQHFFVIVMTVNGIIIFKRLVIIGMQSVFSKLRHLKWLRNMVSGITLVELWQAAEHLLDS